MIGQPRLLLTANCLIVNEFCQCITMYVNTTAFVFRVFFLDFNTVIDV
jgi:hypothetical protein